MLAEVGAAAPPMGDSLTNSPANQTPINTLLGLHPLRGGYSTTAAGSGVPSTH